MKLKNYFRNWEDLETTEDKFKKIEFDALMNHFIWPIIYALVLILVLITIIKFLV